MTPVFQSRFGHQGNCLAACLASILEMPLDKIDFSCADAAGEGRWYALVLDRLQPHGFTYIDVKVGRNREGLLELGMPEGAIFIGGGPTRRGPLLHAVVYRIELGQPCMIHDPIGPSGGGLTELTHIGLVLPTEALRL